MPQIAPQQRTQVRGVEALLKKPAFRAGYNSVLYSLPFEYDKYSMQDGWLYERGRQLAIICQSTYKQVLQFNQNFDLLVELYIQARISQSICGAHMMGEDSTAVLEKRRTRLATAAKASASLESLL